MSKATVRTLGWPLEPGAAPKIAELVEHLVGEMEAAMPASGAGYALIEVAADEEGGVLRLAERLAAAWTARGRAGLVVDAHPTAPFTEGCFEEGAEGFTEILHYGLSPEAAAREREGSTGLWIPAGGRWSLPLESPDEPALALYRLGNLAERVLLLADAGDAEGLLPALREQGHYRLVLVPPSAPADATPIDLGTAVGASDAAEIAGAADAAPRRAETVLAAGDEDPPSRRGRRAWLLLPLLILLTAVALWALRGDWWPGGDETDLAGRDADAANGFSPLPLPVESPYTAGQDDEAKSAGAASDTGPSESQADPAAAEEGPREEPPAEILPTPPAATTPAATPPAAAAPGAQTTPVRRFETRARWESLLAHRGDYFVHVESYRDANLAEHSARLRGFATAGFQLQPTQVDGKAFYRLLVGPFANLPGAAAFRDSLLDRTEEDYCTIAKGDPR